MNIPRFLIAHYSMTCDGHTWHNLDAREVEVMQAILDRNGATYTVTKEP